MTAAEHLISLDILRCEECNNPVANDWKYIDFTNKTVVECSQCKTKYYTESIEEHIKAIDEDLKQQEND